jgi:hypothetical protein
MSQEVGGTLIGEDRLMVTAGGVKYVASGCLMLVQVAFQMMNM